MRTRTFVSAVLGGLAGIAGTAPAEASVQLEPVLTGLGGPVFLTGARDGTRRLFAVERGGVIKVVAAGTTSGQSGSGNGQVAYAAAPDPGSAARTGALTVAGPTFTVTQAGTSP